MSNEQKLLSIIEKLSALSNRVFKEEGQPANIELDLLKHYLLEAYDALDSYQGGHLTESDASNQKKAPQADLDEEPTKESLPISENHQLEEKSPPEDSKQEEDRVKDESAEDKTINERFKSDTPLISDRAADRGDLRKIIDLNKRYLYVNELFSGDESTYDNAISDLNKMPDYQRAAKYVSEELERKLDWTDKTRFRDMFYRSVQKRFGMKGKEGDQAL